MLTAIVIATALILLVLFALFPQESSGEQRAPFWGVNHAHRGLHSRDKSIPENSLAAFTAAVDQGYGIELDIQLTQDGQVVVFHDDDLLRVCGVPGLVADFTYEQLQQFTLHETGQKIPLLWDVIELVSSQVPLIVELKTRPDYRPLCEAAWRILRTYDGDFCVESFDPRIVRWWKVHVPGILRGQLAATPKSLANGLPGYVVGWGLANFWGRPHFIAYEKGKKPPLIRLAQQFGMSVVWTARPEDDTHLLEIENDSVIFEFYEPLPRFASLPSLPQQEEDQP